MMSKLYTLFRKKSILKQINRPKRYSKTHNYVGGVDQNFEQLGNPWFPDPLLGSNPMYCHTKIRPSVINDEHADFGRALTKPFEKLY